MKIDEKHLLQLAAVVKAGGVVEGATLLGLTQPAISRTLAILEKRIGEPLFIKGRRPLQPTPLGRELAQHGMVVMSAARKASETIDSFRLGRSGVVIGSDGSGRVSIAITSDPQYRILGSSSV